MERVEKEKLLEEFKGIFSQSVGGILVDYQGSTVEQLTNLRKNLFQKNAKFRVLKNSLAKIAVEGTPFEGIKSDLVQNRALVYSDEDVVSTAKIMADEAKNNDNMKLISAVLITGEKGDILDVNGIKELSLLPGKEELIAKLLFLLNAPITNFVRVLNEVPASAVRVLQSIADSKKD